MKHAVAAISFAVASTFAAFAHEGGHENGHAPKVLIEVLRAEVTGNAVELEMRLTSLQGHHRLERIWVEHAVVAGAWPLEMPFAQDLETVATLTFTRPPPGIFTAVFDFGVAGQTGVAVIPGL